MTSTIKKEDAEGSMCKLKQLSLNYKTITFILFNLPEFFIYLEYF